MVRPMAATALENDVTLVTRNVHDLMRTGAKLLNPFQPGNFVTYPLLPGLKLQVALSLWLATAVQPENAGLSAKMLV